MGLVTLILFALTIKLILDLSAVMSEVIGGDLALGPHLWPKIIEGLRNRDMTLLFILGLASVSIWTYGIFDAIIYGRKPLPREDGEKS